MYTCSGCTLVHTEKARLTLHLKRSKCAGRECIACDVVLATGDCEKERRCIEYQATVKEQSVQIWVCSRCHYANTLHSALKRHVDSSQCQFKCSKPLDVNTALSLRTPSGIHEESTGLEARIDHICDNAHVLAACFGRSPVMHQYRFVDISLKLLDHLWGPRAPPTFQTIWCKSRMHVHDVRSVDTPGDPASMLIDVYKDAEELRDFVIGVYLALLEIADNVEMRCPEYTQAALNYRNVLRGNQLTTLDVLERNEKYDKLRRVEINRVKLANTFKTAVHTYLRSLRLSI